MKKCHFCLKKNNVLFPIRYNDDVSLTCVDCFCELIKKCKCKIVDEKGIVVQEPHYLD